MNRQFTPGSGGQARCAQGPAPEKHVLLAPDRPLRVIYIAGYGRSGSTALAAILGNHPDVVSTGELCELPRSGWMADEYCACGERGNRCPFWSAVLQDWKASTSGADVARYVTLQDRLERFQRWPRQLRESLWRTQDFQTYLEYTRGLLGAIARVSGRSIIVDSSKGALRAQLLAQIPHVELSILHLVRDVRAVVWSLKKSYPKDERAGIARTYRGRPAVSTACRWLIANIGAGCVTRLHRARSMRIRYEDLVDRPTEIVEAIGGMVGLEMSPLRRAILHEEAISTGHMIAGNRLRMAGHIRLRGDFEWMTNLSNGDRRRCWAIAGWLAKRYRYAA
jgi:hypothetical protein